MQPSLPSKAQRRYGSLEREQFARVAFAESEIPGEEHDDVVPEKRPPAAPSTPENQISKQVGLNGPTLEQLQKQPAHLGTLPVHDVELGNTKSGLNLGLKGATAYGRFEGTGPSAPGAPRSAPPTITNARIEIRQEDGSLLGAMVDPQGNITLDGNEKDPEKKAAQARQIAQAAVALAEKMHKSSGTAADTTNLGRFASNVAVRGGLGNVAASDTTSLRDLFEKAPTIQATNLSVYDGKVPENGITTYARFSTQARFNEQNTLVGHGATGLEMEMHEGDDVYRLSYDREGKLKSDAIKKNNVVLADGQDKDRISAHATSLLKRGYIKNALASQAERQGIVNSNEQDVARDLVKNAGEGKTAANTSETNTAVAGAPAGTTEAVTSAAPPAPAAAEQAPTATPPAAAEITAKSEATLKTVTESTTAKADEAAKPPAVVVHGGAAAADVGGVKVTSNTLAGMTQPAAAAAKTVAELPKPAQKTAQTLSV